MSRPASATLERDDGRGLSAGRAVAQAAVAGLAMGAVAQLCSQGGEAARELGASTAVWVTVGFVLTWLTARAWTGRDRAAWACVIAAGYLFAWLLAYHALFAILDHVPNSAVWGEAQRFVAAVAPACLILGLVATASLRDSIVGDICLAVPLGWSLPEVVLAARDGWTYALVVGVPTLLAGLAPLLLARDRRGRVSTVVIAALATGLVVYLLSSTVLGVLNGYGPAT